MTLRRFSIPSIHTGADGLASRAVKSNMNFVPWNKTEYRFGSHFGRDRSHDEWLHYVKRRAPQDYR
jgi:hypothetical protein